MMRRTTPRRSLGACVLLITAPTALAELGSLTPPPGAVTETMKPLDVVEPRTPVGPDTTPGNNAVVFIIDRPGSFYLTQTLGAPSNDVAIRISASDVTLDLNGFTVRPSTGGFPIGATGSGDGRGISFPTDGVQIESGHRNIRVFNGTIRGFSGTGLSITADDVTLEDLRLEDNTLWGVDTEGSSDARLVNCHATGNGGTNTDLTGGFLLSGGADAEGCTSTDSVGTAFRIINSSSTLCNCHAKGAGGSGFFVDSSDVRLFDCIATQGDQHGFFALSAADVEYVRCTSTGNTWAGFRSTGSHTWTDCVASNNRTFGIDTDEFDVVPECIILRCQVRFNVFEGLRLNGRVTVEDTIMQGNGDSGINASGDEAFIRRCTFIDHSGTAISVLSTDASVIEDTVVTNAGGSAIRCGTDTIVEGCRINNAGRGITATTPGCVIRDCVVVNAQLYAIDCITTGENVVIEGCTLQSNDVGIRLGDNQNALVIANRIRAATSAIVGTTGNRVGNIVADPTLSTSPADNLTQ